MYRECNVLFLGLCDYKEAYSYQRQLLCKRIGHKIPDTLVLVYHPPVITIGRSGGMGSIPASPLELKQESIAVYITQRTGDLFYHGPGQLVCYPILDIKGHGKEPALVVKKYCEVMVRVMGDYGLTGLLGKGPGVWYKDELIGFADIDVTGGVTFYGFALNININMVNFKYITRNDSKYQGFTSLQKILGRQVDEDEIRSSVISHFGEVFNLKMVLK